jgi:hypothetical protein
VPVFATTECLDDKGRLGGHKGFSRCKTPHSEGGPRRDRSPGANRWKTRLNHQTPFESITRLILTNSELIAKTAHRNLTYSENEMSAPGQSETSKSE